MHQEPSPNWEKIKAVIFDVDGTLYTQSRLRKKMLLALVRYYAVRPWRIKDLAILYHFRVEREKKAGFSLGNIEAAQYEWCAEKGSFSIPRIRQVIEHWMFRFPNQYLKACMYPGTKLFFTALGQNGLKTGIYSDYKAADKLKAMELSADIVVCSTDKEVDCLKPNPKGLLYIAEKLGVAPAECLFIGDRVELDAACAMQANMPYLIVEKKPFKQFDFYSNLEKTLNRHRQATRQPTLRLQPDAV
ncbi:HAD family hydrolase [Rufibacter psychrotolerans]|uniref:HAD family hydrolase n=1 Tax=Rufibacter psychrotolerans TaxID=2812556 RepID=UPI001967B858|nr:HAD family hydrolase [Rufibacter sp. SYSU D00308]